mgnify:CR=1 FL=1
MAYTPYNWTPDSFVNPSNMNRIEQGIGEVSNVAMRCITKTALRGTDVTVTGNGTVYFIVILHSTSAANSGIYFGRCSNNTILGYWALENGVNVTATINGPAITFTVDSGVQTRVDVLYTSNFDGRLSIA